MLQQWFGGKSSKFWGGNCLHVKNGGHNQCWRERRLGGGGEEKNISDINVGDRPQWE